MPAGYAADPTSQDVTVDTIATCGDGNEETVSFHNTPLTNVTVSVDSQVDRVDAHDVVTVEGQHDERCYLIVAGTVREHRTSLEGRELVQAVRGEGDLLQIWVEQAWLASDGAPIRIIRRLLQLAEPAGRETSEGIRIEATLSQEELGSWAGASRESVAKLFHDLRDRGIVQTGHRHLLLCDPDALRRRLAEADSVELAGYAARLRADRGDRSPGRGTGPGCRSMVPPAGGADPRSGILLAR